MFKVFCSLCLSSLLFLTSCSQTTHTNSQSPTSLSNNNMLNLPLTPVQVPAGKEIATFAGGCFWCVEAVFSELDGVDKVISGYAGGIVKNPTYREVCSGSTQHAEAIQITFDPQKIGYSDLLYIFWHVHDPTTLNRQGADVGTQYRSAIYYHNDTQKAQAQASIAQAQTEAIWPNPFVTEITQFTNFYPAEDYHQSYYYANPSESYCTFVISPKMAKFRKKFANKLRPSGE